MYEVELRSGEDTRHFSCAPDERLLYAGLRAGAGVSYGCATGTCGECRATVLKGRVIDAWANAPGRKALRHSDEVLLCQSLAAGDCILEARPAAPKYSRGDPSYRRGVIRRVVPSDEGLTWVELELDSPLRFLAGQFVLLSMSGIKGFRAYSPAHDGADDSRLRFVVRLKPGGILSSKLCSSESVGGSVDLFGPLGTAHVRPEQDGDLAIVVGGSGSAVALSLLDWAVRTGHLERHRIDVICGLRTSHCPEVMDRLAAVSSASAAYRDRLRIVVALSADVPLFTRVSPDNIVFEQGLAHEVAATEFPIEQWRQRAVFIAGPPPMVEATMRMLVVKARLNPTKIRYDSFS